MDKRCLIVIYTTDGFDVFPDGIFLSFGSAHTHALNHCILYFYDRILVFIGTDHFLNQVHTTDRTISRFIPNDLRVHRANIFWIQMLFGMLQSRIVQNIFQCFSWRAAAFI